MYVFKCLIINFQSHTSFSKSLNQTFTPPVKTQLLSNCGCFRFILLWGFLQSAAGIVRTGVSTGQKGGTGPTNHLNSYSNKTLKALFLFGNQNTSSKFWQLLNMFCIFMITVGNSFGFTWFGTIYYVLVSVWSISSKSQFCSWPLIAPPPCVVKVCGWNGPGTPSNITATWLLNFTLYYYILEIFCAINVFISLFGGNCEKIMRHCDWNECTKSYDGITCSL